MTFETAQKTITDCMEATDDCEAVLIDFFGGEPMLAFDLIRDVVDWFHTQHWAKGHHFYIPTNGTILTSDMKNWLVNNRSCITVAPSLDGNRRAHNINRSNSYDLVMENLPFFQQHWPDQPLKMTIGAESIPYVADSVIEMEEKGLLFTCNVVFEDIWGTEERKAGLLRSYAEQLDRLVEYYSNRPHLFPAVIVGRKAEYMVRSTDNLWRREDCIRYCGAGHEMVMVDVDGNRYPCHRFSPFATGRQAPTKPPNRQQTWKPEKCAECRLINMCPTCAGFNWQINGDSGTRTTYHCEAFKLEVAASAKLQALRLLQSKPQDLLKLEERDMVAAKVRLDAILELAAQGV